MRKSEVVLLSVLCVMLFSGVSIAYETEINRISTEMADAVAPSGEGQTPLAKKVAVVDFTDLQGNVTELGRFLAEEFSVKLASSGKSFEVVDRTHLKSIIKEHKLSETGIIDSATARKLGSIAGVDALVTGTMTPFGDTIRLSVKILSTESAKIITAKNMSIPKTGALSELINRSIEEVQQTTQQKRTSAAKTGSSEPQPAPKAMQTKEIKGFVFYLQSCIRTDETVTLAFLVESKEKDQQLCIWRETRMFDNLGNEYSRPIKILSNKRGEGSDGVASLLIANIPTKFILTFSGVSRKAESIPLLEIIGTDIKFQMRDIPISQ